MTEPSQDRIVVSLKSAAGFDAPWITIHASSAHEAGQLLTQIAPNSEAAVGARDLTLAVALAARQFQGAYSASGLASKSAPIVETEPDDPWANTQPATQQAPPPAQTFSNQPSQVQRDPSGDWKDNAPMGSDGFQMVAREGISKTGNAYKSYMSGAPQGWTGVKAKALFQNNYGVFK